jgi:23S rRNA pseudouridine1911/1915/1917 synthase
VPPGSNGCRLDQFLRESMPDQSRSFLQKLIEQGDVLVNGQPSKSSYRVRTDDQVMVNVPAPVSMESAPEDIPVTVLFEDEDVIVVNKPAGMVVHPAAGNREHTLVNALLHHCRGQLAGIGGVERPGIVHRLDKDTSGCIVVAKTDQAHRSLVEQFKGRQVKKIYRAWCWERFERLSGRIETSIGRSAQDRKKMAADAPRGRTAITDYQVLEQRREGALVELRIHTGRTHQIRVHMAHIGHPVMGDRTYGRASKTLFAVARLMLHAYRLEFQHPRTGAPVVCVAELPEDFEIVKKQTHGLTPTNR